IGLWWISTGGSGFLLLALSLFTGEQSGQMALHRLSCLDGKARRQRIQVGIGVDLRTINGEFFAPDQVFPAFIARQSLQRSGERPPRHSAHGYGSGWNDRVTV